VRPGSAQLGPPHDGPRLGAEVRLGELTEVVVVHVAASRDHDARVHIVRVVVGPDRREVEARQGLAVPDDRAPERVLAEDGLAEIVVDELRRRVFVHRDLFEHDLALLVKVGERRARQHLDHHLEGGVEVLVEEARVDQRVLFGGGRVGLAAHIVEDPRDIPGAVAVGAFEDEMFDEVRDAAELERLRARARGDPQPEGHRAHPFEALGGHAQAVVQR
jgi:hypothetical protein